MICSPDTLHSETDKIKEVLVGNGYPKNKKPIIKSHDDNRRKPKFFGPKKFSAVLKLSYLGNVLRLFEKNCKN